MNQLKILLTIASLSYFSTLSQAEAITPQKCKVSFLTRARPVSISIEGMAKSNCQGSLNVERGKVANSVFKLSMLDLDTGIELRNKHLRDNYLTTKEFPEAKIEITSAANIDNQLAGKGAAADAFEGTLTLRGMRHSISGTYTIKAGKLVANFDVEMEDYGMKRPSFMGVIIVAGIGVKVEMYIK